MNNHAFASSIFKTYVLNLFVWLEARGLKNLVFQLARELNKNLLNYPERPI